MTLDMLRLRIRHLFRRPRPTPNPIRTMPHWHDLMWTLSTWTPPAGISYVITVKPATGVVNVLLRAEHWDSVLRVTAADTVLLFVTLQMHAEEVLRRSELRRRELGEPTEDPARFETALAAADAAFFKGIGVSP